MSYKVCSICKEEKPLIEYPIDKRIKSGFKANCKKCKNFVNVKWVSLNRDKVRRFNRNSYNKNREYYINLTKKRMESNKEIYSTYALKSHLKNTFGISLETYNKLNVLQNNSCAICQKPETIKDRTGKICRLSVDHCHKTGKVRGLLCRKCNSMIGFVKDNCQILKNAIQYLNGDIKECEIMN